jgi:hypothetical protein
MTCDDRIKGAILATAGMLIARYALDSRYGRFYERELSLARAIDDVSRGRHD